jgi:6-phosphofructokinase 1
MIKKIGILTSGGDSPGMNAAVRAITRSALYHNIEVMGINNGYRGLIEDDMFEMNRSSVSDIGIKGGTILGSARLPEFENISVQEKAVSILKRRAIDALVVIGGDGTYKGAYALSKLGINCVGVPGTIDNDIASTDYTIGFDTALNTIIEAIDKLRDTSSSHHRCSIIEVMGNQCGDLAIYSGLACGAEVIITPRFPYNEGQVLELINYYEVTKKKRHAIVIITEKITDVDNLAKNVSLHTGFSGRATVLGHIQRGGSPSAFDRLLATKLGDKAVSVLLENKVGHCVGILRNEVVSMDINEALAMLKSDRQDLIALHERIV